MSGDNAKFPLLLKRLLSLLERLSIGLIVIALFLKNMHWPYGSALLIVGMTSFAIVLFLYAYTPVSQGNPSVFILILSKVCYIGCSVGVIGILFYFLHLKGVIQMLIITLGTLSIGGTALGILTFRQENTAPIAQPIFVRLIPILMMTAYLYYVILNTNA